MAMGEAATVARPGWREALTVYLRPRVLIVLFLGFSAGLPLALSGSTLLIWMTEAGVNLKTIGLFALVGTPYTIKFLWAPVVDALNVPVLGRMLGRRRGWLLFSQLLLMGAILFLAVQDPVAAPWWVALGALLVATASATQDIVIDAYRVERLDPDEQAAGMGAYVAAYRIGMLVATAGALYIVTAIEGWFGLPLKDAWRWGFVVMAALVLIGMATTLIATEPPVPAAVEATTQSGNPVARVAKAAFGAFGEFMTRPLAVVVLLFVVLFKFCDAFAGTMTAPFVIQLGFARVDYANIVKGVGLIALLAGGFAGGMVARALPLTTALWLAAGLQMASNLMFAWLAMMGVNHWALAATIVVENFTGAIGTVIFVAYLSSLCQSPLHTATQYALLTALAAVGRTYLSSGAGFVVESVGWQAFFLITALSAIPSLILLAFLQARGHFTGLVKPAILRGDDD
jgi:PAT family beta-lactamase induction signal transducer AmpG